MSKGFLDDYDLIEVKNKMNKGLGADLEYLALVKRIFDEGEIREDRTGTGTKSVFGHQMRFDLANGFPLLTTKRLPWRIIVKELEWFLKGNTDLKWLLDNEVRIWNGDAYRDYLENHDHAADGEPMSEEDFLIHAKEYGYDLGPIYGKQWRSWDNEPYGAIDQIAAAIEEIKNNPQSRRIIVSAWNPGQLDEMALPPCHILFQFYVTGDGRLSCQLYQRSGDVFLGIPFNIASYALLTHIIAHMTGLKVGEFIHTIGDAHIYLNHMEQMVEQFSRTPRPMPILFIYDNVNLGSIDDFDFDKILLDGYDPHPTIRGEVSNG